MSLLPPMVTLRSLRTARGLTIQQLADAITELGVPVHAASLSNVELGRRAGSAALMEAWGSVLGIRLVDIFQTEDVRARLALSLEPSA